ncbi:pur operon repressor [Alicyclobacillus shizuokensis]|uniref:pur operon repressor n=1 Tax=Alicyclobacillus shizuokensis TaxID=392014 RepID=UPI001FE15BAD|nr:pur operon repressor [Alicyclobacillus shizuokensis]
MQWVLAAVEGKEVMGTRRAERLIRVTQALFEHPSQVCSLSDWAQAWQAAKSSLSEDVTLLRQVVEEDGSGRIETYPGAAGGVVFRAQVPPARQRAFVSEMSDKLSDASRILAGGFLYMSDVLGDADVLDLVGRWFASVYQDKHVSVVVTVETKGIPLAVSAARYLHVPVVIARREHRLTDGPAVSLHYVSGSERRIQTMSISRRAMPEQARALIVDDFMRAGATVKAVSTLLGEFRAEVVGTAVFMATREPVKKLVEPYFSLFTLEDLQEGEWVKVRPSAPILGQTDFG